LPLSALSLVDASAVETPSSELLDLLSEQAAMLKHSQYNHFE
jgi:hypothetical protein